MSITIKSVQAAKGNENNTIHLSINNGETDHTLSLYQDNGSVWHPSLNVDLSTCNSTNIPHLKMICLKHYIV